MKENFPIQLISSNPYEVIFFGQGDVKLEPIFINSMHNGYTGLLKINQKIELKPTQIITYNYVANIYMLDEQSSFNLSNFIYDLEGTKYEYDFLIASGNLWAF